jgi:hypothetical protein
MNTDQILPFVNNMPLDLRVLGVNLIIGAVLAYIVRFHFFRFSNSLSNRTEFTSVLPFMILTTILIISIVKSSLALSLGLVGALSIVRFRTPIKEPEELAYLFLSIAIGLGLGANQVLATVLSAIIILVLMTFFMRNKRLNRNAGEIYINMSGVVGNHDNKGFTQEMLDRILTMSDRVSLKRYIVKDNFVDLTYYVSALKPDMLDSFILDTKKKYDGLEITILDQRNLPPL